MKTTHVVGAAVIRGATVLAARRSASMPLAGKWEFPGGKVEPGEQPQDALVREITEELGVTVRVDRFLATGTHTSGQRHIVLDVYLCALDDDQTPVPTEHDALAWLGRDALSRVDWAEADLPAVAALRSLLT